MKRTRTKATRSPASVSHELATVESFRRHPAHAAAFLDAVFADGDRDEIMTALRYVAEAFGGVPQLARKTRLNPTTLYRTLSRNGNPEFRSLSSLLAAMDMRLGVKMVRRSKAGA